MEKYWLKICVQMNADLSMVGDLVDWFFDSQNVRAVHLRFSALICGKVWLSFSPCFRGGFSKGLDRKCSRRRK